MKKFNIEIGRVAFASKKFEVEANDEKTAIKKAMELAHNAKFKEYNFQYSVEEVEMQSDK